MVTLTNAQAIAFNSPTLSKLFNDQERPFPTEDAFKLADFTQQITSRLKVYYAKQREIIEKNGGEIHKDGHVTYQHKEHRLTVDTELAKLNAIELEYSGSKLTMTSDWPKLTLAEASILRPLINVNNAGQEEKQCQTKPKKRED